MTVIGETDRTGTKVTFKPDGQIFDDRFFSMKRCYKDAGTGVFERRSENPHADNRPGQEQRHEMC